MQDNNLFGGLIRLHILYRAEREAIYGFGMISELRWHGYELSPGTLYPILRRMKENGYLTFEKQLVAGKIRHTVLSS